MAVVCILSWYQIINSEEYLQYLEQYNEKEAVTSGGNQYLLKGFLISVGRGEKYFHNLLFTLPVNNFCVIGLYLES